jgi:predicted DNA-binding transcriptional regulator AlpA
VVQAEDLLSGLISEKDLATKLGKTARTLRNWRIRQEAPPWCRIGRDIFYFKSDVEPWLNGRKRAALRRSTPKSGGVSS